MKHLSTSLYFQKILFILKKKNYFFISFTNLTKKNIFITKNFLKKQTLSFLITPIYPLYLSFFENKQKLTDFLLILNNKNFIFYLKYNYIIFFKNIKYCVLIIKSKIILNFKKLITNFKILLKFKIN